MGANSNIEWTDHTWNPWIGCTKVSPGCANCYAWYLMAVRYGRVEWGAGKPRVRTSAANWKEPLRWNRSARERSQLFGNIPWARRALDNATHRPRVFCASLADWLDDEVPIDWLADLLRVVRATPNLDWLLLTKRPQLWKKRMEDVCDYDGDSLAWSWLRGNAPENVWVGTTVEDQERANERVPELLKIPARLRFLSCEPLLGAVNVQPWLVCKLAGPGLMNGNAFVNSHTTAKIDWVICGGESGADARPFVVEWADDLRRQCAAAGAAFFMKQLGAAPITSNANLLDWPEETVFADDLLDTQWAAGGSVRLRSKKGGDIAEFPSELQVREFPGVRA